MELEKGGRYRWKNQPERLIYLGRARYPGDSRPWYQFAKVEQPDVVWSEVMEYELRFLKETNENVLVAAPSLTAGLAAISEREAFENWFNTECSLPDINTIYGTVAWAAWKARAKAAEFMGGRLGGRLG